MSKSEKEKWSVTLWMRGCEYDSSLEVEGTYDEAVKAGRERVEDVVGGPDCTGAVTFSVEPAGVVFQKVPANWQYDERVGTLIPKSAAALRDPLPRCALRTFEDGEVRVTLESGVARSQVLLDEMGRRVRARFVEEPSERLVSAVHAELEDLLAVYAARGFLVSTVDGGKRTWRAA